MIITTTITTLFALQFALPLALILWLAFAAQRSKLGFWLQVAASGACIMALALLGIWLWPPWWAPYCYALALFIATWIGLRWRAPFVSKMPIVWGAWITVFLLMALGFASINGVVTALRSKTPPQGALVNLTFPLSSGTYLIVNGGSHLSTNAHLMTLDSSEAKFQAWRGQSYGVDIVQIDAYGLRASSMLPANPSAYQIYGAPALAPCAGQVLQVLDGLPDMQVPEVDREHLAGNYVLLRCADQLAGGSVDVLLGHLRPGSVQVRAGLVVSLGEWLGSVGNSGNTGEPHLHIHAQRPGPVHAPLGGNPLPIVFNGRYLVRNDRVVLP